MCEKYGFKFLYEVKADGDIPIAKYKSENTGITVCIAQVEGPLVNGYFCLGKQTGCLNSSTRGLRFVAQLWLLMTTYTRYMYSMYGV